MPEMRCSDTREKKSSNEVGVGYRLKMLRIAFDFNSIGQLAQRVLVDAAYARADLRDVIGKMCRFIINVTKPRVNHLLQVIARSK